MTARQVPFDDPEALRHILVNTEALLLDFDGPICSIFAGIPAQLIAQQLRNVLADGGYTSLPQEVNKTDDPFDVFYYAATLGQDEARHVESALRAHEVEATKIAEPTPEAHNLIRAWHASGRKLAIVSNNSAAAVFTYLDIQNLAAFVTCVSARTEANPNLLKPASHLVDQAVNLLAVRSKRCTLIGDSASDIEATQKAGTMSIGYVNKPGKHEKLGGRRPDALVSNIASMLPFTSKK